MQDWRLESTKADKIRPFILLARGARQGVRGSAGEFAECDAVARKWRCSATARERGSVNIHFLPIVHKDSSIIWRMIGKAYNNKVMERVQRAYDVATDLVKEVQICVDIQTWISIGI